MNTVLLFPDLGNTQVLPLLTRNLKKRFEDWKDAKISNVSNIGFQLLHFTHEGLHLQCAVNNTQNNILWGKRSKLSFLLLSSYIISNKRTSNVQ